MTSSTTHTTSAIRVADRTLTTGPVVTWAPGAAIAGPVFLAASLVQALTRAGFHFSRDPVSLLSLGNLGWIQDLNFAIVGILGLVGAAGLRREMAGEDGGTWIPRLLAVVGAGVTAASVFHIDASGGFPPGTPAGASATSDWHGILHMVCGSASFLSLIVACFVFAQRFAHSERRPAAIGCRAAGVVFAVALVLSGGHDGPEILFAGLAVGWLTVSACVLFTLRARAKLLANPAPSPNEQGNLR